MKQRKPIRRPRTYQDREPKMLTPAELGQITGGDDDVIWESRGTC
jgi:hypothetical protein